MIDRVRHRQTFQRLAREGVRIRRSTLWCTWCLQPESTAPQVAYAIGRTLGPAVTRNRLRRRLRAILTEIDRRDPLPPVAMLLGATPATIKLTFDQLRHNVEQLITQIRADLIST